MVKKLNQMSLAVGFALAVGMPGAAQAIQGVNFDPDGAGGAGSMIVKAFDWGAGQVLYSNCFGQGALGAGSCTIHAQGSISALKAPNDNNLSIPAGVTYTYVLQTKATVAKAKGGGGYDGSAFSASSINFADANDATSYFRIYRDNVGAGDPVALTGAGYTDGTLILEGLVGVNTFALANVGTSPVLFDQSGPGGTPANDSWGGLTTYATSGSPSFNIQVTSKDDAYFTDALSMFLLNLSPDALHTDNSNTPFQQIDPSQVVAGKTFSAADVGDDGNNDIFCIAEGETAAGEICSGQFQGDAISVFQTNVPVPEPGMLGLLGIGLAGMGGLARRTRKTLPV